MRGRVASPTLLRERRHKSPEDNGPTDSSNNGDHQGRCKVEKSPQDSQQYIACKKTQQHINIARGTTDPGY